jgi:predicted dienelactone hydrolase
MKITVVGAAEGENRHVDVHLWYPADLWDYLHAPATQYTSALNGRSLDLIAEATGGPVRWDPLLWSVASLSAREGPSIFRWAPKYPVIVFSHGSTNVPIDYAFTMEDLASAGFVVAAPNHVNNSQDDVRMDSANAAAVAAGFPPPFACLDGRPSPCSRTQVPQNMADRVRDITAALNELPTELEGRVDLDRVGVLGHSRGTVTALTAAGGSIFWDIKPEPRIKAVMGMAIGAPAITFRADISNVTQPTLLVAGTRDITSPASVSEGAFELLASPEKEYLTIEDAMHRTFDSTLCDQTQSSAAIAQSAFPISRALLDLHTARGILTHPTSGVAIDFCAFDTFITPTDVRQIVTTLTGFNVTETNAPRVGLTAADLRQTISEMAITFFEHVIGRPSSRWHHFQDDFPIGWLIRHHSNRSRRDEYWEADERCYANNEC